MIVDTTVLKEGIHHIGIAASDTVGHKVFKDIIFVADNTKPQLEVRSPQDNTVVADKLQFEIVASDSSLSKFSVLLPNGTMVENNNAFSMDTASLAEGEYDIVIKAEDGAGNFVEEQRAIKVDRTLPDITISSPSDGATVSGTVSVKFDVKDESLDHVSLTMGEKSIEIPNTGSYSLDTQTLFDAQYTLELAAEDRAGNINSETITINTANFGPSLMNVWIVGIAIGAAIGAGVSVAVLMTKYRRKRVQPQQDL